VGLFGYFVAPAAGLPTGLSERLAGYPGVLWLIATGVFLFRSATGRAERLEDRLPHGAEATSSGGGA
jgi:hypothetical protein